MRLLSRWILGNIMFKIQVPNLHHLAMRAFFILRKIITLLGSAKHTPNHFKLKLKVKIKGETMVTLLKIMHKYFQKIWAF